ncbi:MAG: outer membrane beta-barrel protein [Gammaproteobacteria bacterium]|nr:outer membrane beta-barrel protein [Gammaproteobacteria bacterium]
MKKTVACGFLCGLGFLMFYEAVTAHTPSPCFDPRSYCCPQGNQLYFKLETGCSHSRYTDINVDPRIWDAAIQGYGNDLGCSEFYGAAIGYQINPLLGADFSVIRRPSFEYQKFQTPPSADTPNFLGTKTRYFDFQDTSIMFNLTLYAAGLSDCLTLHVGRSAFIQPFIGAGLGIAYNTVENFHSVLGDDPNAFLAPVSSIMLEETKSAFAWQLNAGLELVSGQNWHAGVGYRYFDGGRFNSNDFVINEILSQKVSPWQGDFRSNEGFVFLKYAI